MPAINRVYPHLLPDDIEVWERYLANPRTTYLNIEYDVRVGEGRDPGESHDANIRRMGLDLSKRRIDAVGHTATTIDIIEITTIAGLHAVGQLTAYPILYRQTYNPPLPLVPVLVCSSIASDAIDAIRKTGALIYVV